MSFPATEVGVLYTVALTATFCVVALVEVQDTSPLGVSDAPLATEAEATLT